tara:strand:+ start:4234 stop:5472 length:1239 start_codon:yes stop_codon:yes gene_type:complete
MSLKYIDNILMIEDVSLKELASNYTTPFYVYSVDSIKKNYNTLKSSLRKDIYYSVKANSNQAILSLLFNLGAGADVVSGEELKRVLAVGINPNKIIFEGVGKLKEDIEFSIKNEIKQINVESLSEIKLINKLAGSQNKKVNIGIRINPDIDIDSHNKISTGKNTDKFGITLDKLNDVISTLNVSKNICCIGISCHVGSQIFSINIFEQTFKKIINVINIFKTHKFEITNINLGGGMGVDSQNNKIFEINKLSQITNKYFGETSYKISFEPGRYLVAESGILVTKVLTVKKSGNTNFLIVDAGMNNFIRPALYDDYHKIDPIQNDYRNINYAVAGPICESSDIFHSNIKLPEQNINDILTISNVGAYGSVMSSNYNSKVLSAEIMVSKDKHYLIRPAQKIEELISKDIVFEDF